MIILDEKKYAEDCLNKKTLSEKPFVAMNIIAKYYYHIHGYRKKKIIECLTDFMSSYYPRYEINKEGWDASIEKIASNAGKHELYQIKGVWLTSQELAAIRKIGDIAKEKLMFTILCVAKLANLKNPNNEFWVALSQPKEIFELARISKPTEDRFKMLNYFYKENYIYPAERNGSLSYKVLIADNDGDRELFVDDFRELGYTYLNYIGGGYIHCAECGRLTKANKNNTKKYCSYCAMNPPKKIKVIECVDCGKMVVVRSKNNNTNRCSDCYKVYNRERKRQWYRRNTEKNQCMNG